MLSYSSIAIVLLAAQGTLMAENPQTFLPPQEVSADAGTQDLSLPSEVVAARVRDVLRDHSDSRAWKQLADALPAMALAGGADLGSTLEAGRLADSISAASLLTTVRESIRWVPPWLRARIEALPMGAVLVGALVGALLGVLVLVLLTFALVKVLNWMWKGLSDGQSLKNPGNPPAPPVKDRSDTWWVKSLVKSGRPVHEIARQTRMAQDAILILLELHAEGTPQRVTHGEETRRYVRPSTGAGG